MWAEPWDLAFALSPLLLSSQFSSLFNKSEEPKDESPSSWRLGLRKTGSQSTLSEPATAREALRDRGPSVCRSASSPRISALLGDRDKVRFPP